MAMNVRMQRMKLSNENSPIALEIELLKQY